MSNLDRQIANTLVRIHRELFGNSSDSCWWFYSGKLDIYHCPHTAIYGKDLLAQLPDWVRWNTGADQSLAKIEWDQSPESVHEL